MVAVGKKLNLQGVFQCIVQFHNGRLVSAAVTVIRSGENCHHIPKIEKFLLNLFLINLPASYLYQIEQKTKNKSKNKFFKKEHFLTFPACF